MTQEQEKKNYLKKKLQTEENVYKIRNKTKNKEASTKSHYSYDCQTNAGIVYHSKTGVNFKIYFSL